MKAASPWWEKGRHQDRRARLVTRARIKTAMRTWFDDEDFVEVEPGCLQVSPGNEAHLHGFATTLIGSDLSERRRYLHTSPEFAMKKLLAAGETQIYAFAPVFRNREHSALHAPEFTMLEWYRAHVPFTSLYDDCTRLLQIACDVAEQRYAMFRDRICDLQVEPEIVTVDTAFQSLAGVDLGSTYSADAVDRDALAALARREKIKFGDRDSWADIFSRILTEKIEPRLGQDRPTLMTHYPAPLSALARPLRSEPKHAERFELYVCGVELANGFGELTDPVRQRAMLEAEMALKQRQYGEHYPIDADFIDCLAQMPPAAGCAVGFDRLVMLATDAKSVHDVMWTPTDVIS